MKPVASKETKSFLVKSVVSLSAPKIEVVSCLLLDTVVVTASLFLCPDVPSAVELVPKPILPPTLIDPEVRGKEVLCKAFESKSTFG